MAIVKVKMSELEGLSMAEVLKLLSDRLAEDSLGRDMKMNADTWAVTQVQLRAQNADAPPLDPDMARALGTWLAPLHAWTRRLHTALQAGSTPDANYILLILQGLVMRLTDLGLAGGLDLPTLRVLDERVDADEDLAQILARAEVAKLRAGQPFDVVTLFKGQVPTFEEVPDCGGTPCPACDARREYFANYKVH